MPEPLNDDEITEIIDGLAGLPYGGEVVDQRTHALQTGWHAAHASADDELLVAATLHDIGRSPTVATRYPCLPHEDAGAQFARQYIGERAANIIRAHVPAKRYLVATDPTYAALLSPSSVESLRRQGGAMAEWEIAEFRADSFSEQAIALRRWDDAAKDPDGPCLNPEHLLAAYHRLMEIADAEASHARITQLRP